MLFVCLFGAVRTLTAQVADVRVVSESAPPGGLAVVQIELTDPEPIFSGRFTFKFPSNGPLREIRGIGLFSDLFDVIAAVRLRLSRVDVSFASFSSSMGVSEQLPIFVVAADVDAGAFTGDSVALDLDLNQLKLNGPNGQPYAVKLKPGTFTVGGLSLNSVTPSRGIVPAGTTLVFRGVGFDLDADLSIAGVSLNNTQIVNSTEIRAVAGQTFRIEGRRIRIRNKDADEEEFFFVFTPADLISTTTHPLLSEIIPIFGDTTLTTGVLRNVHSGAGSVTGVAFQNSGTQDAQVTVEVFDENEFFLGQKTLHLAAGERSLHEVSELLPNKGLLAGGIVGATSTQPIGMLGMIGLATDETLTP
ncbi:MAG: IPT/TIG domain-containing protein, partial [Acidobacteria bacterium]|nr:IPT/TIG domain-containing protein [Acidobacteriota bacterium]